MTDRTTIRLSDERKRLLGQASEIIANNSSDDPPRSDVIDATLTHLIQSVENVGNARGKVNSETIQRLANTDVVTIYHRTSVDSPWR